MNPALLGGLLLVFGATSAVPVILLAYLLLVTGIGLLVDRGLAAASAGPPPGASRSYFDDLVSELYEMMRWTIFAVLLAAAIHGVFPGLEAGRGHLLEAPAVAAGLGLLAGAGLCIPYPAVPFAASLFFGLLPPAGLVAFVLAAALIPANRMIGFIRLPRRHDRRVIGMHDGITILAMAVAIYLLSLPISSLSFGVTL